MDPSPTDRAAGIFRLLGVLVALHVIANLIIRVQLDITEHTLWLSNVSHALCALGLILVSYRVLSIALCAILVMHTLWIADALIGLAIGTFPIGITSHIRGFSPAQWVATSYHFYLLPLLLVTTARRFDRSGAQWTPALFALLLILSTALPEASNVNYAHDLAPSISWTAPVNAWPAGLYLIANFLSVTLIAFAPVWWLLGRYAKRQQQRIACITPDARTRSAA